MYDFLLPAFQFVRFRSLQQNFFTGQKRRTHIITKWKKLFCIRCQIRDHAGDGASCTRAFRPLMLSSATMHAAIGTFRRDAAFKKISGSGLLLITSSPQTEASIYWSMPDCFQYPSATRRVVEVATAT